ncbi:transcription factor MYB119-like [Diospyros lotus]|uniref:transcription factor MYB119-like n=1 Tax=Diospyros lotus TaxID=55363 RepID=UPI00224C88AA|nr:transcription factor MYB119-like [Diospyros lotus]
MEGGGETGFPYCYFQTSKPTPPLYRSSCPLTAIERFLFANNHFPLRQPPDFVQNKGEAIPATGHLQSFPSHHAGAISSHSLERDFSVGLNGEDKAPPENSKGVGKRGDAAKSTNLIKFKRMWSDEEDSSLILKVFLAFPFVYLFRRKLVELVTLHGEKNWALIAECMLRRTGKQCRDRWHNHLRPHIKKNSWTEEEEHILVEAHKAFGNKWAKIAKSIPSRTENSIKNHWNTTLRRQKSNKRIKKSPQHQRPTILEDYIKGVIMIMTPTEDLSNNLADLSLSDSSIDDFYSSQIMNQTGDDELNFMKNFFRDKNEHRLAVDNGKTMAENEAKTLQDDALLVSNNVGGGSPSSINPNQRTNINTLRRKPAGAHLSSDLQISYLLDGPVNSDSVNYCFDSLNPVNSSSSGKKDMDLAEMVFSF